jgi:hypothetical protein
LEILVLLDAVEAVFVARKMTFFRQISNLQRNPAICHLRGGWAGLGHRKEGAYSPPHVAFVWQLKGAYECDVVSTILALTCPIPFKVATIVALFI